MNNPPPKKPAPVPHATDPYTDWYSDADPPPAPGPLPTGERALLRFHVPAENTAVDLGYGSPTPGIRMVTNRHVHLTAREPLTTISLGAPHGDGIEENDAGLHLFTDGAKWESVRGPTHESYGDTRTETTKKALSVTCGETKQEYVKGEWTETCDNAKAETIAGTLTQKFRAEHNLTVGKLAVHEYGGGRVDKITGGHDLKSEVSGNRYEWTGGKKHETIDGDWIVDVTGKRKFNIQGDHVQRVTGIRGTFTFGASMATNVGATVTTNLAVKHETSALKIDYSVVSKREAGADLDDVKLYIKTSVMTIFK